MRISDWSSDVCSSDLVEKLDERSVKFTFEAGENRELPLIMGQLPVLPKHYWESRDFTAATLEPPLGSGPYRVKNFEPGRFEVVERVEDYWGKDIPVRVGTANYDTIRYEYFLDRNIIRQEIGRAPCRERVCPYV